MARKGARSFIDPDPQVGLFAFKYSEFWLKILLILKIIFYFY